MKKRKMQNVMSEAPAILIEIKNILDSHQEIDADLDNGDGYWRLEWWDHDDSLSAISLFTSGRVLHMKGRRGNTITRERFADLQEFEDYWKGITL